MDHSQVLQMSEESDQQWGYVELSLWAESLQSE